MKYYLITGPESLLKAASEEAQSVFPIDKMCSRVKVDTIGLMMGEHGQWFTINNFKNAEALALPADWDKFMGILAELKKPKLPEYVRGTKSRVYKVKEASEEGLWVYDCYGKVGHLAAEKTTASITEQEFIEGGLKELAEAGYVNGATVGSVVGLKSFVLDSVLYLNSLMKGNHSDASFIQVQEKGFCFTIANLGFRRPVGKCTLKPALPTTSQGIPYTLKDGYAVVYGKSGDLISLQCSTIKHLIRQGVTGLVTNAGQLTKADLELLTK